MADYTITDLTKMKIDDLCRELKSRGLPSTGDKAELISKLQAAMSQDTYDEHADINLDSDELDSDGVLDEDKDKSQDDLFEDSAVECIDKELALAENPSTVAKPTEVTKTPQKSLKRKITMNDNTEDNESDSKTENKAASAEKIVLDRSTINDNMEDNESDSKTENEGSVDKVVLDRSISISLTSAPSEKSEETPTATSDGDKEFASKSKKITIATDAKTRLELRAQRFGLPVKVSDADGKEARKQRFGQVSSTSSYSITSNVPAEDLDKLKKRAERFGQSVSKLMTNIENKEKLAKRKAKFGMIQ